MATTRKKTQRKEKLEFDRGTGIAAFKPVVPLPGEEKLFEDLEKYRQMALKLGADEAIIFPVVEFPQDIRVWWRCQLPRCTASGANSYCPPTWRTPWDDAKRMKTAYKYAIVFKVNRPPEFWTGPQLWTRESDAAIAKFLPEQRKQEALKALSDYVKWQEDYKKTPTTERVHGTASIGPHIIAQARRDGHQFAVTFGVGACQYHRCAKYGATCVALTTGLCRFPLKVSPEGSAALYQDFSTLSGKMGWKTWVAGVCIKPDDVPEEVQYFQCGTTYIE